MGDIVDELIRNLEDATQMQKKSGKEASKWLEGAREEEGYCELLAQVIEDGNVDDYIRLMAATEMKNLIRFHWIPKKDSGYTEISKEDKNIMRDGLVGLMLNTQGKTQKSVSEAVNLVAKHDFPDRWGDLLDQLMEQLNGDDYDTTIGVLTTMAAVFQKYRGAELTEDLKAEINEVLAICSKNLFEFFMEYCDLVGKNMDNGEMLVPLMEVQEQLIKIIFSLSWQDLPPVFEENLKELMDQCLNFLQMEHPDLESKKENEAGLLDRVQAEVINMASLYCEKYDDVFPDYLGDFVDAIWKLLTTISDAECYNNVAITSIKFLSATASNPTYKDMFADEESLKTICENVIIPNMKIGEQDEENFEMNPMEYIRRDVEGSDSETRRRTAYDLVKALCQSYEKEVTEIYGGYVFDLIAEYEKDPEENWKDKDVAVYLVTALATQKSDAVNRASATINEFVEILPFFGDHIIPELKKGDDGNPILQADALKFVLAFRHQLSLEDYEEIFGILFDCLKSDQYVIVSYACMCIDFLLKVRDINPKTGKKEMRVTPDDLQPMLEDLLKKLFEALQDDSDLENEYIMKAILRVAAVAKDNMAPFADIVTGTLKEILEAVCKNPRNPTYHHYLFETIAAMIKFVCGPNRDALADFEDMLWEPFEYFISEDDESEFSPYAYQLLSALLEMYDGKVPKKYVNLIPKLLDTDSWHSTGNIPGLTRMLVAVLKNDSSVIVSNDYLELCLGSFQYMFAHNAYVGSAFELLTAIIACVSIEDLGQYVDELFKMMIKRFKANKGAFLIRPFAVFLSSFMALHGADPVLEAFEDIKSGLSQTLLKTLYIPFCRKFESNLERKQLCAGMISMLTESQLLISSDDHLEIWGDILYALLQVIELPAEDGNDDDGPGEEVEYSNKHVQLAYCPKPETDLFPDLDPVVSLAEGLKSWSKKNPGFMMEVVEAKLDDEALGVLSGYFETAGISEPYIE